MKADCDCHLMASDGLPHQVTSRSLRTSLGSSAPTMYVAGYPTAFYSPQPSVPHSLLFRTAFCPLLQLTIGAWIVLIWILHIWIVLFWIDASGPN